MNIIEFFPYHATLNHIVTHNMNPKNEHGYFETSHETFCVPVNEINIQVYM